MTNELGKLLVVGSINVDVIYGLARLPYDHEKLRSHRTTVVGGGSGANTAYWLGVLGVPTTFLGSVGDDLFGQFALQELGRSGVDVSMCHAIRGRQTGIVSIFVIDGRKRMVTPSFTSKHSESMRQAYTSLDTSSVENVEHVHVAIRDLAAVEGILRRRWPQNTTKSMELNGMYDSSLVECCDFVFSNLDELRIAIGDPDPCTILGARHKHSDTTFFITNGSAGALIVNRGVVRRIPTNVVAVVDPTGGGDAFNAGVLFGLLARRPMESCAQLGLALAGAVIQDWGARPNVNLPVSFE